MDDNTIWVRRHPTDWKVARYWFDRIHELHWADQSGGVGTRMGRDYLCGYVYCDQEIEGEVAHSCRHGKAPHYIKVCITKAGNSKEAYNRLVAKMSRPTAE